MSNAFGNIPRSEKSKGFGVISAFLKRLLHVFARYLPMFPSWRATIHRWRGVKIGKNIFIGTEVFIDDADPTLVTIEDDVTIIAQSTILGHTYIPKQFSSFFEKRERTIIKKGAYIALGVKVLPGVTIGEYAIIGACSLVTKDVPAYTMVVGIPAKPVKTYSPEDLENNICTS